MWHDLGEVEALGGEERGHQGRAHFVFDDGYALDYFGALDLRSPSCRYPVDFDVHTEQPWPAFLLDILPAGAARRALVGVLGLADNLSADWPLLLEGARHPPGNLRVASAVPDYDPVPGFTRKQINERDPWFVEYASQHRTGVAGTSGAQGESPKFLLTEDEQGRLHAEGALPDARARRHWLVKWPRGNRDSDRAVLRNEAAYMRYAERLGLRVNPNVTFERDTLYVRRFDRRVVSGGVERLGLESLCSLAGVSQFGARVPQENLTRALARFSTHPEADVVEFVRRDVLNVALGNTDNHARNSALLKALDGEMTLSPLFDFAPMFLDDAGIPRCCRWTGNESMGYPSWPEVAERVGEILPVPFLRPALRALATELERGCDDLADCGADDNLVERLARRIDDVRRDLAGVGEPRKSGR